MFTAATAKAKDDRVSGAMEKMKKPTGKLRHLQINPAENGYTVDVARGDEPSKQSVFAGKNAKTAGFGSRRAASGLIFSALLIQQRQPRIASHELLLFWGCLRKESDSFMGCACISRPYGLERWQCQMAPSSSEIVRVKLR